MTNDEIIIRKQSVTRPDKSYRLWVNLNFIDAIEMEHPVEQENYAGFFLDGKTYAVSREQLVSFLESL